MHKLNIYYDIFRWPGMHFKTSLTINTRCIYIERVLRAWGSLNDTGITTELAKTERIYTSLLAGKNSG